MVQRLYLVPVGRIPWKRNLIIHNLWIISRYGEILKITLPNIINIIGIEIVCRFWIYNFYCSRMSVTLVKWLSMIFFSKLGDLLCGAPLKIWGLLRHVTQVYVVDQLDNNTGMSEDSQFETSSAIERGCSKANRFR